MIELNFEGRILLTVDCINENILSLIQWLLYEKWNLLFNYLLQGENNSLCINIKNQEKDHVHDCETFSSKLSVEINNMLNCIYELKCKVSSKENLQGKLTPEQFINGFKYSSKRNEKKYVSIRLTINFQIVMCSSQIDDQKINELFMMVLPVSEENYTNRQFANIEEE